MSRRKAQGGGPAFPISPVQTFPGVVIATSNTNLNTVPYGSNGTILTMSGGVPVFLQNNAWLTGGNAGTNPATDGLGTTDAQPLRFITNGTEKARIHSNGNVGIGTTTNAGFKLDTNGTGIFRAVSASDNILTVRGATSQTANLQEWQNNSNANLLTVTSGGTISSFQSTGAKDLINHTRSDGMTVRLYTTNGYDAWLQPGNGGDMKLGNPGLSGFSHTTTIYGGAMYYTAPLISTNSVIIQRSTARYGVATRPDLDVEITDHNISGGGTTAYCSNTILRGKTIVGYGSPITVTDASTLRIDQAPTAGANATLTNTWALHVVAGNSKFGGGIQPASMADSSAINDSIYYSTTAGKLVYKDSSGTVNNLY